jgi:hypothetical protein
LVVDGDPLEPGTDSVERPSGPGEMRMVLVKAPGRLDRLFIVDRTTPQNLEAHLMLAEPSASTDH